MINHTQQQIFFVYVLYSHKDSKLYTGYTPDDVFNRFSKHQAGLAPATKYRRPLELIYFEGYICRDDALRRESYLKTTAGKRAIRLMLRKTLASLQKK